MQYEFCLLFGVGAEDLFFCLLRFLWIYRKRQYLHKPND